MIGLNVLKSHMVKVKKLHPEAILPTYGSEHAACFDLSSIEDGSITPHNPRVFSTGLSFEIPPGHVMMVYSRSGHGFKHGVRLSNCVGVIDADYRGEVMVKLKLDGGQFDIFTVNKGDRIAQAMIVPVEPVSFFEVIELGETVRGAGGFGSTGN